MKPNEMSLAHAFGLSNASLSAIKKRELQKAGLSPAAENPIPLSAGANAFAFRTRGLAEFFQRKTANV